MGLGVEDGDLEARADLIFNFGAPYQRTRLGEATVEHRASNVDAQRRYPIRIAQQGEVACVGVRFRTGGLTAFTDVPMHILTDRTVPLAEVFGPAGLALEEELRRSASTQLLDDFFRDRWKPPDARFLRLLERIPESAGVEALCSLEGVSVRTADRLFARHLGLSPKLMARVARFQRALQSLMRDPGVTLAEVAAACGYYDQPHFIKDFRLFSGGVPRQHRGYFPADGPADFAPNVVQFLQDGEPYPA